MVIIAFVQFCLMHSYNKSQIAIRSQFQRDMALIQWETMKNRKVEEEESRPANWMWNCSLKSLPEASGLITAPWQAKCNIVNQIHKKVGHLPSWPIPASFAPFSLQICLGPIALPFRFSVYFLCATRDGLFVPEFFYGWGTYNDKSRSNYLVNNNKTLIFLSVKIKKR